MENYKDLNDYEIMYMVSENDESAKELIYEKYRPLIYKLAYEYLKKGKKYGLELDDFVQEGYFALFCAMKNYTEDKNCLFYTYAMVSIKSKMQNLIVRNSTFKNYILNNSVSIFQKLNIDNENTLLEVLEDKNAVLPDWIVEEREFESYIKDIMYEMPVEESYIFELKLNGFSIQNISNLLGVSTRIVNNALLRIRKKLCLFIEKNNS